MDKRDEDSEEEDKAESRGHVVKQMREGREQVLTR